MSVSSGKLNPLDARHASASKKGGVACRTESDSLGDVDIPADALYGAQTQRALENFQISGLKMPRTFIRALGLIKAACARVNGKLQLLPDDRATAISEAAMAVAAGDYDAHFPVDVFQTGSGTSSHMNANEVIAHLAEQQLQAPVHANDHVNLGQSSNDIIPSAIHLSALLQLEEELLPALSQLVDVIATRAQSETRQLKTARTHLMDAVPMTLGQELSGWQALLERDIECLNQALYTLRELPVGATAVGTGLNAHPQFAARVCVELSALTGHTLLPSTNPFAALSVPDALIQVHGQLKILAVNLMKICNDLRWMNSGPLCGLAEIRLPALQPGSSIMPGKVNPVIPEAVAQVCAQVMGNDTTLTVAAQSGQFQLNVMLPVIAHNTLQSLALLTGSCEHLASKALKNFKVNRERLQQQLAKNPLLATALNNLVGYDKASVIAHRAATEQRDVLDIALEETNLDRSTLELYLDPQRLASPHVSIFGNSTPHR